MNNDSNRDIVDEDFEEIDNMIKRRYSFDEVKRDLLNKKIESDIILTESFMNIVDKLNRIIMDEKIKLNKQYEKELFEINFLKNKNINDNKDRNDKNKILYDKNTWIFHGLENKLDWNKFQNIFSFSKMTIKNQWYWIRNDKNITPLLFDITENIIDIKFNHKYIILLSLNGDVNIYKIKPNSSIIKNESKNEAKLIINEEDDKSNSNYYNFKNFVYTSNNIYFYHIKEFKLTGVKKISLSYNQFIYLTFSKDVFLFNLDNLDNIKIETQSFNDKMNHKILLSKISNMIISNKDAIFEMNDSSVSPKYLFWKNIFNHNENSNLIDFNDNNKDDKDDNVNSHFSKENWINEDFGKIISLNSMGNNIYILGSNHKLLTLHGDGKFYITDLSCYIDNINHNINDNCYKIFIGDKIYIYLRDGIHFIENGVIKKYHKKSFFMNEIKWKILNHKTIDFVPYFLDKNYHISNNNDKFDYLKKLKISNTNEKSFLGLFFQLF